MPSQICQGKRLRDLSVFTSHKSFTFWFPTLQECLMGGFLSCSKWVECECSITPVFVPTRSRKPLTEIYEFKFNVDTRAIERAMFDQKVWFNPHCLWLSCFWKMVTAATWWSELLTSWSEVVNINCYRSQRNTISTNSTVKNMKLQERYGSQLLLKHLSRNNSFWQAIESSTLDSILFAKHAASHFMQAEEEKFIKAMRREMVPIARPMPQFPPPFVPQRYWTITVEVLNLKS